MARDPGATGAYRDRSDLGTFKSTITGMTSNALAKENSHSKEFGIVAGSKTPVFEREGG